MTKEEWIKIYNAKDGTWDKDYLIDKAYEIITSPIKTNYDRMRYENKVVRFQSLFFHLLPEVIEEWNQKGYRIINTNQSKTFSGEDEVVIFLEREVKEKETNTNYDRIKSMSVEEMAAFIVKIKKIFVEDAYKGISETLNKHKKFKEYSIEIDNSKVADWEKEEFEIQKQWLLQEVKEMTEVKK